MKITIIAIRFIWKKLFIVSADVTKAQSLYY